MPTFFASATASLVLVMLFSGCETTPSRPGSTSRTSTDTLPHATMAEVAGLWEPSRPWHVNVISSASIEAERDPWNPDRYSNVYVLDGGKHRLSVTLYANQVGGRFIKDEFLISDPETHRMTRYDPRISVDSLLAVDNECLVSVQIIGDDSILTLADFSGNRAKVSFSALHRTRMLHLLEKCTLGTSEFALASQGRDAALLFFPMDTVLAACDPASDWRTLVPRYVTPVSVKNAANEWEYPKSMPIGDSGYMVTPYGIEIVK